MIRKGIKCLTLTQRRQIKALFDAGVHKKIIAETVGVHLATIYLELSRGSRLMKKLLYTDMYGDKHYKEVLCYDPDFAEKRYRDLLATKGREIKLGKNYDFARYIEKRVTVDKLSPCAALGEAKAKNLFSFTVSKTTLYRYIEQGYMGKLLLSAVTPRKKHYRKISIRRAPSGTSIERRPMEINMRQTFGHWEMDCICGPTKAAFLVLSERLTRKEIIFGMPDQTARSVVHCLNVLERRFGKNFRKVFRSITVDNGSEFSDVEGMERSGYGWGKRTKFYYCHPYCSGERGTNERLNREIRRLVPKGSDLSVYSAEAIQRIEDWVNAYPRHIFGFRSSEEVFQEELQKIAG